MPPFAIHPQLRADSHHLGRFHHCHLLLNRNAALPWFILLPEVAVLEWHEIDEPLRQAIDREVQGLAAWVKRQFHCDKLNLAAIGNRVAQLHIHLIGRRQDDPCWPDVVWGARLPPVEYGSEQIAELRRRLGAELGLMEAQP